MKVLVLNFKGRDSWDRPVYECEGRLYVDVSPIGQPSIHTKSNNEFDGEPDMPVSAEFEFPKGRDTWNGMEYPETEANEISEHRERVFAKWENWDDGWFHGIKCSSCGKRYCGMEKLKNCPSCNATMEIKE